MGEVEFSGERESVYVEFKFEWGYEDLNKFKRGFTRVILVHDI